MPETKDRIDGLKSLVGKYIVINGLKVEITIVDAFGSEPHFGVYGETQNGRTFKGWIAASLVSLGDIKDN